MNQDRALWKFYAMVERERKFMLAEMSQVKGFMP